MLRNWYYSLVLLLSYVGLFLYWKQFPSRAAFSVGGLSVVAFLAIGFGLAYRRKYFCNRIDACLHAYVIVDLVLESVVFEFFPVFFSAIGDLVNQIHDNNNFIGCALTFTALVGGYRWFALRRIAWHTAESRSTEEIDPLPV